MAAGTITEREYKSLVEAMKDIKKELKDGLESVNTAIMTIHKDYSERITRLETNHQNSISQKILLALLFTAIGWIINSIFK